MEHIISCLSKTVNCNVYISAVLIVVIVWRTESAAGSSDIEELSEKDQREASPIIDAFSNTVVSQLNNYLIIFMSMGHYGAQELLYRLNPFYARQSEMHVKQDVFSFGLVLGELVAFCNVSIFVWSNLVSVRFGLHQSSNWLSKLSLKNEMINNASNESLNFPST